MINMRRQMPVVNPMRGQAQLLSMKEEQGEGYVNPMRQAALTPHAQKQPEAEVQAPQEEVSEPQAPQAPKRQAMKKEPSPIPAPEPQAPRTPTPFEDRMQGVQDAIQSGVMDPQGLNSTDFNGVIGVGRTPLERVFNAAQNSIGGR